MDNAQRKANWRAYYTRKRIVHQWTQLDLLGSVECQKVLEIGPSQGLVTAMLANAGYDVHTLGYLPNTFPSPTPPHLIKDLRVLRSEDIKGFDAILCCETLEHLEWDKVGEILSVLRGSGAKYLIVSVPFMSLQVTCDFYLNAYVFQHYFSLKKFLKYKTFTPGQPGDHQWEIGYKGYPLEVWEKKLTDSGWAIRRRDFTAHCRSVFHLLEAV